MSQSQLLDVAGVSTRVLTQGDAGPTMVFLHGGTPGVTPYCGGSHLWGDVLSAFAADCRVIAMDLPGAGGTDVPEAGLAVDA
ncbi:MAG: alpha/beta hydrolase, partial [Variovorax sp.]